MESDGGDFTQPMSGVVSRRHVVEAMMASAVTLQFYDWLVTLPQEVEYIWRASWNWSKALYLLTRYIPFATIALALRSQFAWDPSPESCKRSLHAISWLAYIGLDLAEIVLAVRTYAVWNRDKRVGIGLALLFGLCKIPDGIILSKFLQGVGYAQNPYPGLIKGCVHDRTTRLIFANWIMVTILEGVDLILVVISAVKTYREHTSNLMHVIYRDGIRFYLLTFCATLANVLITLLLPTDFITIGSDIEIVLHSILACRLMIGIREASRSSVGFKSETFELSRIVFDDAVEFARWPPGECTSMDVEACAGPSRH